MKTFATILVLAVALSITHAVQAADSSLELVLSDAHVVFTISTNISMEVIFRNVGETNLSGPNLQEGLSVILDGKEYKRDPKRVMAYEGGHWFESKTGRRDGISFSDFLIPPERLVSGRHTVAVRDASSESNTLTIFIEPQK